jgi:hypothetical protein
VKEVDVEEGATAIVDEVPKLLDAEGDCFGRVVDEASYGASTHDDSIFERCYDKQCEIILMA